MINSLSLPHGALALPEFLPDATRGVVRSLDSTDLEACGTNALVMNTFHLMQHPGSSTIQALGGLHRMAGWNRPIITDSGGFQVYSLIRQNPKFGSISNKGATFTTGDNDRKFNLSPEKSIQLQIGYDSDVAICLDDPTHVDADYATQAESVRRTIDWARRSKAEFTRLVREKKYPNDQRPLLFAVVQGGGYADLRRQCAEALLEIGFDGYGYGGWPLDSAGNLLVDMLGLTRELIPPEYPMHALGVAHPANIVACTHLGYEMCDGALPTRDARHARLYAWSIDPQAARPADLRGSWFSFIYTLDDKHIKSTSPVSPYCDCLLCKRYSLGYLHHLLKVKDTLAFRLSTIHNLRFMAQMMEVLRKG